MRATSKASFEAASRRWEPVLSAVGARGLALGEQLFSAADLLAGSVRLGRALTDPSRRGEDKAALVESLFRGKVADEVTELLQGMARDRWSAPGDLSHSVEILAVDAVLAAAEAGGRLETVEDELFRVDRVIVAERELRMALADREATPQRRVALADSVFGNKVSAETGVLLRRALVSPGARSVLSALHATAARAAARRERLVATVIAAAPLTPGQVQRLSEILARAYGRQVQVNVGVDERVIGGMRVSVGSEVVDATVLARLDEARHRLAG